MPEEIVRIQSAPGIKRDGTVFDSQSYVDGQWCRFQRGQPRKMGGYRSINKFVFGLPRTLHEYTQDNLTYLHIGSAERVERLTIDGSLATSVVSDRTPTTGYTSDPENLWQFDVAYDTTNGNQLVAQVAPNLGCICNSLGGGLFIGDLLSTAILTKVTTVPANFSVTGGVVTLAPYTVAFGNDGYIAWSVPNTPGNFTGAGAGNAYVTGQKIIRGIALRGGPGNSPSGLFWSADALVRASYVGGTAVFQFDTISTQSSILSAGSVIEYDGVFYWAGSDRFLMFNGVVRELENNFNINFFFDNLNVAQRQKVYAFKVPRFAEIWWCFPKGESDEPNHAVVYNVRENIWYDTALPGAGRGAAASPSVFRRPILTGVEPTDYLATAVAINAAGTGYVAGETLTLSGGSFTIPVEITISTVGASGEITAVTLSNAGRYTTTPSNPAAVTGGSGSGATFNITFERPYKTWVHEIGTDLVDEQVAQPIPSFFETAEIALPVAAKVNKSLQVLVIEPDFVQSGDMTLQVAGRANTRAPLVYSDEMTFADSAATPAEQVVHFKETRRLLRFRFTSNVLGGNYEAGNTLAHLQPSDGTMLG